MPNNKPHQQRPMGMAMLLLSTMQIVITSQWMIYSKTRLTMMMGTADLFESIANRLEHDDILFGSLRWLENFREMKQATIDPLYKDCSKHWAALQFNLQMLMLKAHHDWSDTSFNDL